MSKFLTGIAALTLLGAAALPLQATAAERHDGISNVQSTELSAQRRHWRGRHYGYRYYAPRRYWGPGYGYYGGYPYYGYGYPYGYYRPGFALGVGPFGFRVF
jgi:hypothetical protein